MTCPKSRSRTALACACAALAVTPLLARGDDGTVTDAPAAAVAESGPVASAAEPSSPAVDEARALVLEDGKPAPAESPGASRVPRPASLDFDLLGQPKGEASVVDHTLADRLRLRRTMLLVHQGVGFGVIAAELTTTVLGQLNYSDRFNGGSTGQFRTPHAIAAYTTLGLFGIDALVALTAPKPLDTGSEGFDRVKFHKYSMFTAKAGMVAQGILGAVTASREGYVNQKDVATVHLALGYFTLAAVLAGVSALVL